MSQDPGSDAELFLNLVKAHNETTGRIASLLRSQQVITGDAGNTLTGHIAALDQLAEQMQVTTPLGSVLDDNASPAIQSGAVFMKRVKVTRDIDLDQARDLLERVPRACIAFASDRGPQSQPIVLVWRDNRYWVGIPEHADLRPGPDQEVVLLVDEGVHYFDLRAIYIRGRVHPAETPVDAPAGHIWFEVVPLKTVAWDYGTLREVGDAS